jgi:beta-glucosidase
MSRKGRHRVKSQGSAFLHLFRQKLGWLAFALCSSQVLPAQHSAYLDPSLPAVERARDLVSRMTLEEKTSQLEHVAPAIPRLGIPEYATWNEALHGVAYAGYATVFPQAIGMAATFDPAMVRAMGSVVSNEGRAKYNQAQREGNHRVFSGLTFWSPNINIFRDPRWGRGQETYGEDPFLTARMGVAFVAGVQGEDPSHPRAIATSKHFAVHSGPERLRHEFGVDPSSRDLEETYLPAFRATVTEGRVQSVMCAYNSIDGWPACTNRMLLQQHLRDAWGFRGFVVSDCNAIDDVNAGHHKTPDFLHSAAAALQAGTDLSCNLWSPGFHHLAEAVREGLVSEELVTRAVERLYTARFELGMFDPPESGAYDRLRFSDIEAKDRAVALKAAEESLVLLKNDGTLPLKSSMRIAVVGPNADQLASILGNYAGTPLHPVTPLEGMLRQFGAGKVGYAQGSTLAPTISVPVPRTVFSGGRGLKTEFFATPDWTGRPVAATTEPDVQADWESAPPVPELATHDYSVRSSGSIARPGCWPLHFLRGARVQLPLLSQRKTSLHPRWKSAPRGCPSRRCGRGWFHRRRQFRER